MNSKPAHKIPLSGESAATVPVGAFVSDDGGLCLWASDDFCSITGIAKGEIIGQFWFRVLSEKSRKDAVTAWETAIPLSRPFNHQGQLAADGATARTRRVTIRAEFVRSPSDPKGYCIGYLLEAPDLSSSARYDRLSESLAKLEKAERDKFDLTAALNVADTTVNQLQSDLRKAQARTQELAGKLDASGKQLTKKEEELAQTCSEKFSLETQIVELKASHSRIIEDQQRERVSVQDELERKLVEKSAELKNHTKTLEQLRAEVDTLKRQRADGEKTLAKALDRAKSAEAAVERERTHTKTLLREKDEELERGKKELEAQLLKMLGEASDLLSAKKRLEENTAALERTLQNAEGREKELLGRIHALEQSLSQGKAVQSGQEESLQRMNNLDRELDEQRKQNEELLKRIADLGERLAKAQEEAIDGKNAIRALSNSSTDLELQHRALRAELATSRSELEAARSRAAQLEEELERIKPNAQSEQAALQASALSQLGRHFAKLFHEVHSLLLKAGLGPDHSSQLANLKGHADYAGKLTSTLTDTLELELGSSKLNEETLHLKRMLQQLGGVFEFRAAQRGASFEYTCDQTIADELWGDPQRLEQALSCLIGNLLKLLPESCSIKLRVHPEKEEQKRLYCRFDLRCDGVGDLTTRQLICALGSGRTALASQSSDGLGLTLARRLIERMRGDLNFSEHEHEVLISFAIPFSLEYAPVPPESTPIVRLDAHAPTSEPAQEERSSEPLAGPTPVESAPATPPAIELEAPAQELKILVAEDNRINQNTILRILKRHHHHVTLATNGKDAVEKAQQESYDLIFMDCQMPQLDGYQATRAIRKHEEARGVRSTIVGMSAHLDMDGRERCLNSGMDEYMSKPIQEDKIVETIRKLFP